MSYALSDPSDSCFQQKCQHTHGDHCFQCEELGTVLEEIQVAVEEASFHTKDDHDEATYLVKHSRDLIHAWKAHQLRTVRQDQSRLKILRELDSGSVFITQDWAIFFRASTVNLNQTGLVSAASLGIYPLSCAAELTSLSHKDLYILSRTAPKEVPLWSPLWHISLEL